MASRHETMNKYSVEIFGQRYLLKGEAAPETMTEVASLVDKKMTEMSKHASGIAPAKLAILVALNIANELLELRREKKEHDLLIGKKTKDLIERIEDEFEELQIG